MNGYPSYPGMGTAPVIGMNWVENKAEIERSELPPGGQAVFFDKANDVIYVRSRDSYTNVYTTRVLEYKELKPVNPYVTRDELEEMFQKFLGGANNEPLRANEPSTNATSEPAGVSKR